MLKNYLPQDMVLWCTSPFWAIFRFHCMWLWWGCDRDYQSPHPVWIFYDTVHYNKTNSAVIPCVDSERTSSFINLCTFKCNLSENQRIECFPFCMHTAVLPGTSFKSRDGHI